MACSQTDCSCQIWAVCVETRNSLASRMGRILERAAVSEGNQNIGFRRYPPAPNEHKLIYPEWISLNFSLLKLSTALDKDSLYCCRASRTRRTDPAVFRDVMPETSFDER